MPILEKAMTCCFFPSVGVVLPKRWDIWASFNDPFLITEIRSELTPKGEDLLLCNRLKSLDAKELKAMFWRLSKPGIGEAGSEEFEKRKRREDQRISELVEESRNTTVKQIIENYGKTSGVTVCTCQPLGSFSFFEAQLLTKAQVKAMVKVNSKTWEWSFDPDTGRKINFSHCLLWWRD